MNTRKRPQAGCHPDRLHLAKGLCKQCYDKQYQENNREKHNRTSREWAKNNPAKRQATKRKYLYGIDSATVAARFYAQDGLCKICQLGPAEHLDHNHKTGIPRSLLCGNCNRALGLFKENITTMETAIEYIRLWDDRCIQVMPNTGQRVDGKD